ncbi:hypothetical protein AVEN_187149-1 [Araneus ventricosus]|uniref:Uncharacterized protein n=1 Tax=Araneus ventricosus TaxID=182803 RepID=A0A4Y2HRW2_ARAVE|nr:hypothetical protein AVEN_103307-1 [Araneus ventricosus]GBM67779.1 hypothetical protein AVEN_187149-1 [Araneus ventricosus]
MNRENTRDTFYLDYIFSERVSTKYHASDRSFVILNNIESESIPQTAVSGSIWLREHVTAKQRRTTTNHPRNRNRITLKDCFQRGKKRQANTKGQRQTPQLWVRRAWCPPLGRHEKAARAKKERRREEKEVNKNSGHAMMMITGANAIRTRKKERGVPGALCGNVTQETKLLRTFRERDRSHNALLRTPRVVFRKLCVMPHLSLFNILMPSIINKF